MCGIGAQANWANTVVQVTDPNNSPALLPCPFCGEPPRHLRMGGMLGDFIMCSNHDCGAWVAGFVSDATVAGRWNRRDGPQATDPESSTPLPCPFCGAPASTGFDERAGKASVCCSNSECRAFSGEPTKAAALAGWNRRTPHGDRE